MTPNEIKFLLAETGVRQIEIARALGKPPAMVHLVVHGRSRNRQIAEEIARRTGVSVDMIIGTETRPAA